MKLAQFFSRILNRETAGPVPTGTPVAADQVPVVSAPHDLPASLETLVSGFSSIQSLLKDDESVELPAVALLARLPEAMRGPAWQNGSFPDTCLLVDQKSLYEQLQKGRLQYPVEQFRKDLPPGWLNSDAKGLVDLDLAQVVDAMPPEFFGELAPVSSEMREISGMHDYFTPKPQVMPPPAPAVSAAPPAPPDVATPVPASAPQPVAPVPVAVPVPMAVIAASPVVPTPATAIVSPVVPPAPPPEPVAAPIVPAPVAVVAAVLEVVPAAVPATAVAESETGLVVSSAKPAVVEPEPGPAGWDGVETRLDAGGQSVDINLATLEDLLRLRGIGPSRAKQLLEYRQRIGRFSSIFDLAKVPGLGGAAFSKLTGLSLKQRIDRHQALNRTLALPAGAVPSLAEITVAIAAVTGAAAGVLTNHDGMPLAVHGMEREEAEANAALTPQLFRRIGGYLRRFQPGIDGDALILPGSQGQLLLLAGDSICLILRFARPISRIACRKAIQIQGELDWLLGIRAVVKSG